MVETPLGNRVPYSFYHWAVLRKSQAARFIYLNSSTLQTREMWYNLNKRRHCLLHRNGGKRQSLSVAAEGILALARILLSAVFFSDQKDTRKHLFGSSLTVWGNSSVISLTNLNFGLSSI
jgi:hypothetical protein